MRPTLGRLAVHAKAMKAHKSIPAAECCASTAWAPGPLEGGHSVDHEGMHLAAVARPIVRLQPVAARVDANVEALAVLVDPAKDMRPRLVCFRRPIVLSCT